MNKDMESLWLLFLNCSGLNSIYRALDREKAIILMYHGICSDDFTLLRGYDERHIPVSLFEEHLRYLRSRGYVFKTMTELVNMLERKESLHKVVVLTFDDGFSSVIENAHPLMKEFGAKGCFYIIPDIIGKDDLLWSDRVEMVIRNTKGGKFRFLFKGVPLHYNLDSKESYEHAMKDVKERLKDLSDKERQEHLRQFEGVDIGTPPREFSFPDWDQVASLDREVLEIGSHSMTHPVLTRLTSGAELEREINGSKSVIEKKIGYRIDHFNYPMGAYNERVIQHVKRSGYKSAVTIRPGHIDEDSNRLQLGRIPTNENILLFKASVSGTYFKRHPFLPKKSRKR